MKILILNGPNLNLLGTRETTVYGSRTFPEYLEILRELFSDFSLEYRQTNLEGELVTWIQEAQNSFDGVILNAGGYTHTSVAIADAIAAIRIPVIEVHISNLLKRETFRHESRIGPVCAGSIMGFGLDSYRLGIESLRVLKTGK